MGYLRLFKIATMVIFVFCLAACKDKEYSNEIKKSLERIYGTENLKDYEVRGLPTTANGVGTPFSVEKVASKSRGMRITDTQNWWEIGVSEEIKEEWGPRIISDGNSGAITLKEDLSTSVSLNVLAPLYKKLANLDASIDYTKGVTVKISANSVVERGLNLAWFNRAIAQGYLIQELKSRMTTGDLMIVAYDIAFDGYEAEITINTGLNPKLSAKLAELEGAIEGVEGTFKLDRTSDGSFTVSTDKLVVAAVDIRKMPSSGVQSGIELDDWEQVNSKENANLYSNLKEAINSN